MHDYHSEAQLHDTFYCSTASALSMINSKYKLFAIIFLILYSIDLLWVLPMHSQTSQANSKSKEQILHIKCKTCNCKFKTKGAYDICSTHPAVSGKICSDESSKTEVTFTVRADLFTGILKQRSYATALQNSVSQQIINRTIIE
jgi:hypothetical protein